MFRPLPEVIFKGCMTSNKATKYIYTTILVFLVDSDKKSDL